MKCRAFSSKPLTRVLSVFCLTYPLVILTLIALVKADLPLEQRILSPLHFSLLLLSVGCLAELSGQNPKRNRALAVLWLLLYLPGFVYGVHFLYTRGRGYLGPAYRAPAIYQKVKAMGAPAIHSNDRDAVLVWLDRFIEAPGRRPRGPYIVYRASHPLPPRHEAAIKRRIRTEQSVERYLAGLSLKLEMSEGGVELWMPAETQP